MRHQELTVSGNGNIWVFLVAISAKYGGFPVRIYPLNPSKNIKMRLGFPMKKQGVFPKIPPN